MTGNQVYEVAQRYLVEPSAKGLTSEAVLGEITEAISQSSEWEKFDFDLCMDDEVEEVSAAVTA